MMRSLRIYIYFLQSLEFVRMYVWMNTLRQCICRPFIHWVDQFMPQIWQVSFAGARRRLLPPPGVGATVDQAVQQSSEIQYPGDYIPVEELPQATPIPLAVARVKPSMPPLTAKQNQRCRRKK